MAADPIVTGPKVHSEKSCGPSNVPTAASSRRHSPAPPFNQSCEIICSWSGGILLRSGDVGKSPGPRTRSQAEPRGFANPLLPTSSALDRYVRPRVEVQGAHPMVSSTTMPPHQGAVFLAAHREAGLMVLRAPSTSHHVGNPRQYPFARCPESRQNLTIDTLVRHLGRCQQGNTCPKTSSPI